MFLRKKYSDAEILAGLQSSNKKVRTFFENHLYNEYTALVRHGQKRYHFTESESLDRYVDAYMGLLKYIREGKFTKEKKIAPLFKTFFDRRCVDFIKKKTNSKDKDTSPLDEVLELSSNSKSALEHLVTTDIIDQLRPTLQELGDNCQNIIHLWSHGYKHQEIADNLATVSNAKSSKAILSKCLKKLRKLLSVS